MVMRFTGHAEIASVITGFGREGTLNPVGAIKSILISCAKFTPKTRTISKSTNCIRNCNIYCLNLLQLKN